MSDPARRLALALEEIADESIFNQQRFAEEDDTDYFLRCFKAVKDRAREALTAYRTSEEGNGENPDVDWPGMCERAQTAALFAQARWSEWMNRAQAAEAKLATIEWSASISGMMGCPVCSRKMDEGHLGDCLFSPAQGYSGASNE
jgi:hypothetical protein